MQIPSQWQLYRLSLTLFLVAGSTPVANVSAEEGGAGDYIPDPLDEGDNRFLRRRLIPGWQHIVGISRTSKTNGEDGVTFVHRDLASPFDI